MLTTQEAADLLDVSGPTLVRQLTEEIPYTMRARHRRVMLRHVDYRDRTRRERRQATFDARG
jgi:excisionase family DNA binding protein